MILIANDINDKKRKYEDRIRIQTFQNNCLHFKGPDILQNRFVPYNSFDCRQSFNRRCLETNDMISVRG